MMYSNLEIKPLNQGWIYSSRYVKAIKQLKLGIWLYLLLLFFEGALRRWFLPGLATPLLVVRDPIALWLVLRAIHLGLFRFSIYAFCMATVGLVSFFTTLLFGHENLAVAIYGIRPLILHFPLIFAIRSIFDRDDVIRVGKFVVWLTIPMAILIALQFYSPQSAWVNVGVGGDGGAGFGGALGYFRPPATFTFTNGTALYFGFAASYIFYFWMNRSGINKIILLLATAGLLAAIPFSISRTLLFSVIVTLLFAVTASLYQPKYIGAMIITGVIGLIALVVLSNTEFFQTATEAFTARFESANESEGGLEGVFGDRYLGGMIGALSYSGRDYAFWGQGIGMGTNVGAMLLTGRTQFLISEGEWGRLIGEMGPLLGILAILIRLFFSGALAVSAFKKLSKGDILPWLLLSFALLNIPQSQWAQPTSLGFSIVIGGLVLASLQEKRNLHSIES